MRLFRCVFLLTVILASCAPQPAPVAEPTSIPSPTATVPLHAEEIRFALIGQPQDVNVWELFDASGANYANYALRSEYWPRLYHLAPPALTFESLAADGMPSAAIQDGDLYSATVKLRTNLKWTDGSAFTAEDVAFTVNTALAFELGFDWNTYYSVEKITRAEAVDASTIKFYFKQQPNVADWQYGALQGPIVQKAFWETLITNSIRLLPDEASRSEIEQARQYLTRVQRDVDDLTVRVTALRISGQEDRQLEGELNKRTSELGYAQNSLNKLLEEYLSTIEIAKASLYSVNDEDEPTLGTWIPAGEENGIWINKANPDFPFGQPGFDRAVYFIFDDIESAYSAFANGEVDVILSEKDLAEQPLTVMSGSARSSRFLVFNPDRGALLNVKVRKALSCVIDIEEVGLLRGRFVPEGVWNNMDAGLPCEGFSVEQRINTAVGFLKEAGYSWEEEPGTSQPGLGLKLPDGQNFPRITLLSTFVDVDADRVSAATYIEQQALRLGIPLDVELTDLFGLQYAVYSSKKYDLAILGWRLSEYPGYLCEWFGGQGNFQYGSDSLQLKCEALGVASDLDSARQLFFEMQTVLVEDVPFIPLYSEARHDAFQNVQYPFDDVTGGLGGLYGAPSYALPAK